MLKTLLALAGITVLAVFPFVVGSPYYLHLVVVVAEMNDTKKTVLKPNCGSASRVSRVSRCSIQASIMSVGVVKQVWQMRTQGRVPQAQSHSVKYFNC